MAKLPPVSTDNARRLHLPSSVLPAQSDRFLTLGLAEHPWRPLSGFDLSPSNPLPQGCSCQIQVSCRLCNAPATGPNQLDCVSLELWRQLPSLSLHHVQFQMLDRAK